MKSLIQKLVETDSPSGYEKSIREVIRAEIEQHVDSVRVDKLGNLIAEKHPEQSSEHGLRVMLAAHMDEIGLMVSHVDENGFIRFQPIGGVRPANCIGGRVRFLTGKQGVINTERLEDQSRIPAMNNLYIDVGASSREETQVRIGDVAVFERPFTDLGNRLVAKAMDDRIAVAVLISALQRMSKENISSPHHIFGVFSVQEEVGVRGATTAAYGLDPDLGLAIDVTATGDTPKGVRMDVGLGKGPAIKARDSRMLSDPRVVEWMVQTAESAGLPYQIEVLEMGSTDASAIQLTRAGVPVGCLSIPCRYIHSPSEMVDFSDVQNSVDLLVELLRSPLEL